jgi:hypothetical protein
MIIQPRLAPRMARSMRPLVAVRNATAYDPRFVAKSPLLWAIEPAAGRLAEHDDFPPPAALDRVFEGEPPVRFVRATPRSRGRRRGPLDLGAMYDARITLERCVPTRPRSWHDILNALVWGTFPRAKSALHARQHRAITERVARGSRTLPSTRTREQDALALVDEGGVVVLARDSGSTTAKLRAAPGRLGEMIASGAVDAVIFGHAVYESLVFGVTPAAVAAVVVGREAAEGDLVREADAALARALADPTRLRAPDELCRVDVLQLGPSSIGRDSNTIPTTNVAAPRTAGRR